MADRGECKTRIEPNDHATVAINSAAIPLESFARDDEEASSNNCAPGELEGSCVHSSGTRIGFFASNLQSGREQATKAMLVEAGFSVFAGGLIGAISQHLGRAKPVWATALFLCVALPGVMTVAQAGVHHIAGTPHQSGGLVASFCLAGLAAAYTLYAMRQGAMLGGIDQTAVRHDVRALPSITLNFLLALPRVIVTKFSRKDRRP